MRFHKRTLMMMLVALLPVLACAAQSTYEATLAAIDKCMDNMDWPGAEKLLLQTLRNEPANPSNFLLLSNLGTVHRNMDKPQDALADYNNALAIAPNASTILHNRAALYMEMDSVERAFDDYRKILTLRPKDTEAMYYIGIIALEFGDMELSESSFNDILAVDKDNIDARRGLALWNKLNGRIDTAEAMYTEIIVKEHRITNYINRAECYLDLGKLPEAQSDISEAQKLNPSSPDVYLLKARLAQLQYRADDAANYAVHALELGCDEKLAEPYLKRQKKTEKLPD